MRRFIITTLYSSPLCRRSAYCKRLNGGQTFSGSPTTTSGMASQLHDGQPSILCYNEDDNDSNMKGDKTNTVKVEVISREHIKPSSPTPQNLRHLKLSIFDQVQTTNHHPLIFFYLNHNNNNNYNVEEIIKTRSNHLKQSLSQTLTQFYPFAGKIASEFHIDCNDDGVYFVETRVNQHLKTMLKNPNYKFLQRLIPVLPHQQLLTCYISVVQINFFNCGSVAITIQHSHRFVDGISFMTFLKAWAANARQDVKKIHPKYFVISSMFPQNDKLSYSPYYPLWHLAISPPAYIHGKSSTKRFVFDPHSLQKLKTKASKNQRISRTVAVLALFWKCITYEKQSKLPTFLHIPINIRPRCSPPLSEYTIGNCLLDTATKFDPYASDLQVANMADYIKKTITGVNSESIEVLKGEIGSVKLVQNIREGSFSGYNTSEHYWTTSLCNSGTKEIDFGWGKPIWLCDSDLNNEIPVFKNRIIMMDSCKDDGIEVWVTLEQKVMDAVICNQELLTFASVDPCPI